MSEPSHLSGLMHRRSSRGKRPFLQSMSSSSLSDDTAFDEDSPLSCSLPISFNGPVNISARRPSRDLVLDLEEIPEDCLESDM